MSNIVSSDPVADMLTRVRNAVAVRKAQITMPYSKLKEAVAQVLADSNFIDGVGVTGEGKEKTLALTLNVAAENPRITEIKSLSTPGRRFYVGAQAIPTIRQGRGIVIISTSKGLMTGTNAKAASLGRELICSVF